MKLTRGFLASSLVLVSTSFPSRADYFWDGNDTSADADGGAGVWDTSTLNWDTLATGGANTAWSNAQTAVFGGIGGNVSVTSAGITAAGITFNSSGYLLQNNFLTLGSGNINTAPGVTANIQSYLTGSGLNKTGTGTLTVSGTNSYTGATVISAGTLKPAAVPATNSYRYYRFTVFTNGGDGYNQIAELHYYKNGLWIPAVNGSAAPTNGATGTEQFWGNANDNKGANGNHTKFGINTRPYSLIYDFGAPTSLDAYNWATGNDSAPGRNPRRWTVSGSNDGTNFTVLDDRSGTDQAGPSTTYTWSATNAVYVTNDNSANIGAANAYPLGLGHAVPSESPLQIASAGTLDVNGLSAVSYASLADSGGGGGTVTNGTATATTFRLGSANTNTSFSGVITDVGSPGSLSLLKIGSGAQTLTGTASNTYTGTTTLGGTGKLVLAKTGGAIAIPGNINLSSSTWNGQNSGIVLAGDEQIANTAVLTWTTTNAAGGPQSDSFFRPNGRTETIGGLVSSGSGGLAIIENRGSGDATPYGTGTIIINVANAGTTYSFNGGIRNMDGGTGGGAISITKTGPGTQVLSGGMGSATGPAIVNDGVLRLNNTFGATTMTVTGTGTLQGTGTMSGAITVQSGGTMSPGTGGAGTFTANTAVAVNNGGTLAVTGTSTLNGAANINSGGTLSGTGTVSGAVAVLSGGQVSPGTAGIGTIKTNSALSLAGNVTMEINKSGANLTNDQVSGFSSVSYGGTLTIVATGDTPVLGDSFQLFIPGPGGTYGGGFSGINGLPTLPGGLQWETTTLLTTGRINVVNNVSSPSFSPAAGGYVGAQSVTISSDSGSTIYYTTDGSPPSLSSPSGPSPVTGINIPVDSVVTLRAFATKSGMGDSPAVTAVYRTVTVPKWNVDNIGDWSTATNWLNQVIPSGSGITADFTFPQSAPTTVNLDSNRTVGSLVFGNTAGNAWTLATGNGSILTLAVPSGTPSVAVNDVNTTISTLIAGSQGLVKSGPGLLTLTGTNTYLGNTAINGGSISTAALAQNGSNSPIGAGSTLSFDGGTLVYTGAGSIGGGGFNREVTLNAGGGTLDLSTPAGFVFTSGIFSGNGGLTKKGTRQLIINTNNTYTGNTLISEGEIQMRTLDALGTTAGKTTVASGARLCAGGALVGTINENIELNGLGGGNGALQANDTNTVVNYAGAITLLSESGIGGNQAFTISGAISGTGNLIKVSGNNVTLSGSSSNTYVGTTTLGDLGRLTLAKTGGAIAIPGNINMSTTGFTGASGLNLAGDEQIADTSILTWTPASYGGGARSNSYFNLMGHTETVGGLVSTGTTAGEAIQNRGYQDTTTGLGMGTLIINATGTYTYNTTIRDFDAGTGGGSLAITKTGPGTQILSGGMSYTGPTTVAAGTLGLDTICTSPVTVLSGGTLQGFGGTNKELAVNAGGTIMPGSASTVGIISGHDVTVAGKLKIRVDGAIADQLLADNNLDATGGTVEVSITTPPTENTYVIAKYTGTYTGDFTLTGATSGFTLVHDDFFKEIRLEYTGAAGFAAYASSNGLTGAAGADFDKDGIADAVEYVLGTSPTAPNGGAPVATVTGGNLVFTFTRADSSMTPDVAVSIEVGGTLLAWPNVYQVGADTASSSPGVTVTDNGATDTITLTVPQAPDAKKFAHLKVVVTP